ncbi:MAG: DUF2141 domain-containing protein [Prolixibacteraceae bacterium]
MKNLFMVAFLLVLSYAAFTQNSISLDISGVKVNGGTLYIALFNSEKTYEEKLVFHSLKMKPSAEIISLPLNLPPGEYLFSVFQDHNENGLLDVNFFGLPKETFGFSNYEGKSIPGNFNRHKVLISGATTKITVHLFQL